MIEVGYPHCPTCGLAKSKGAKLCLRCRKKVIFGAKRKKRKLRTKIKIYVPLAQRKEEAAAAKILEEVRIENKRKNDLRINQRLYLRRKFELEEAEDIYVIRSLRYRIKLQLIRLKQLKCKVNYPGGMNNICVLEKQLRRLWRIAGHKIKKIISRKGQRKKIDQANDIVFSWMEEGKTLNMIGMEYGLTRERIRQILNKFPGINKIRGVQIQNNASINNHDPT